MTETVINKHSLKTIVPLTIKKLKQPENIKKLKKLPLITGYALFIFMTCLLLISSGINILIESGVPEKTIVQLIGALFIICGLGCARELFPGIGRIMEK